jgi:hypothetical protein
VSLNYEGLTKSRRIRARHAARIASTVDFVTVRCETGPSLCTSTSGFKCRPLDSASVAASNLQATLLPSPDNTTNYCSNLLVTYRASPFASSASTLAAHVATLRCIKVLKKGPKINKTCYTSDTGNYVIWGSHTGDCEGYCLLGECGTQPPRSPLHTKHVASKFLQNLGTSTLCALGGRG